MKTSPIFALALAAALAAFFFLPFTFEIVCSVLFAAGLALVVYSDYARAIQPVTPCMATVAPTGRSERLGLAA